MQQCTTCFKVNKDESLKAARDEAKTFALEQGYPVAIVQEGEDYIFYNAFVAYQNSMNIIEVVSHL